VLLFLSPLLVNQLLEIPLSLKAEAQSMFVWLAFGIPLVFLSKSLAGVLGAAQRFDLVNAVRIPTGILTFCMPLVGIALALDLSGIVGLILGIKVLEGAAFFALDFRMYPALKNFSVSFALLPRIFGFGFWVMVSNLVSPLLVYIDRFLIGSLRSVTALAYYAVPYEAVTRLLVIPSSLTMSLFPAFSALSAGNAQEMSHDIFVRSLKFTMVWMGPIILALMTFGGEILQFWLGSEFRTHGSMVLSILALGVFLNALAQIPFTLLHGMGRPDIPAKFHLLELPGYLVIAWFLIGRFGIEGAAAAWSLRVGIDLALLLIAALQASYLPVRLLRTHGLGIAVIALVGLASATFLLKNLDAGIPGPVFPFLFIGLLMVFTGVVWCNVFDKVDRGLLMRMLQTVRGQKIAYGKQ